MTKVLQFICIIFFNHLLLAQTTLIPDVNFEQELINQGIDSDGVINGEVLTSDIASITMLDVSFKNINDLTGIEDFDSLQILDCSFNLGITQLNINENTLLEELYANDNNLQQIDLTLNTSLRILQIRQNSLTELDLLHNILLETIDISSPEFDVFPRNEITTLDLSANILVQNFNSAFTYTLASIIFPANNSLRVINVAYCNLSDLDLSQNSQVSTLILSTSFNDQNPPVSNNFTEIDLSTQSELTTLFAFNTSITSLNVRSGNNQILETLLAFDNPNLNCIQVDDEAEANSGSFPYGNWNIDETTFFSNDCTLSIEEQHLTMANLYPNPVQDFITLRVPQEVEISTIEVFDLLGKRILLQESNFDSIFVNTLPKGIFFLRMNTQDSSIVRRFIKG